MEIPDQAIPEDIKGTCLTTVKNYDPRVKARALELYLTTDLTLSDIAIDLHVPEKVISTWSKKDSWIKKREDLELEFISRAENSYRRFIAEKRTKVAERHERIASQLEDAIEDTIKQRMDDGMVSETTLKRLAEALSSVTGVSARAVGIGQNTPALARAQEEAARANTKQPLVMIGIGGSLPPDTSIKVAQQETIDVQTEAYDS